MQYFQDTATGKVYAFNPDVVATSTAGVYSFKTAEGVALTGLPATLQPCPGNAPPAPPAPTLAQQAATMMGAGIQIASAGTPALDGTYPVDPVSYQNIMGVVAAISAGLGVPGGGSTFNWLDTSGMPHGFSAANFTNFAKAVMTFLYALNIIAGSNTGTLPAQPVTIA